MIFPSSFSLGVEIDVHSLTCGSLVLFLGHEEVFLWLFLYCCSLVAVKLYITSNDWMPQGSIFVVLLGKAWLLNNELFYYFFTSII
jgi:hypothetical protein